MFLQVCLQEGVQIIPRHLFLPTVVEVDDRLEMLVLDIYLVDKGVDAGVLL